ncbi:PLP-dependent aminotransferase family protein [Alicyclobacillus sp. SO9]|uniref:MocR-like pyridoxine biosynthesis transcription factor PdxR n=1 Tax=Alicyclobacillus sp. SO9 TaxID=2665646 RepID=UPI0018E862AA|nr:PLP-dependent aminotransferase family protein [Alicyclobacillus sp. SO9]QQE80030.1 PLP-dependent aminotransferase family protein [Alicyclobacillus sp. SO9]
MEFVFTFDEKNGIPYYHQLYQFVRHEIESGKIAAGSRLPSVRSLCDSLKVSKTTVEQAYQQLVAEGYIESKHRSGYFSLTPEHSFGSSTDSKYIDVLFPTAEQRQPDIDFHPARVDVHSFPRLTLKRIANEVWNGIDQTLLDYGDAKGELGLRKQIATYLQHSRGVRCSPQQIVVGSGIQFSLQFLVDLLGRENMQVAMEDPGYGRAQSIFNRLHVGIKPISLDHDGISVKELYSNTAQLVYVTPSHQFPLGMVMSYSKRIQLLEWAEQTGSIIIEDDYDGEFRYSERPVPSLQGIDSHHRVVYIGTFSKALAPSFRMNYMVLPVSLLEDALHRLQEIDSPVPKLQQLIVERFMDLGHFERHIRRVRRSYRQKHSILLDAVRSEFGELAAIEGHGAGLHVLVRLQTNYSEVELAERAEAVGVRVYFPAHSATLHIVPCEASPTVSIMLGFAGLGAADIVEGVSRLRAAWL